MIRVGIAGVGFMGWIHWLAYQKVPGIQVAAICSRDSKKRRGDWRGIQGNFGPPGEKVDLKGIATYDSYEAMLADPKLDLIDITLPPAMHADAVVQALRAGKHVFCEKPLALEVSDCRRMTKVAKESKKQLLVAHVLPFTPEYAWAYKTATSGKYGKLLGGTFKRVISDPSWIPDFWAAGKTGGPMLDLHVHDTHFIQLLFGKPRAVSTCGRVRDGLAEYFHTHFSFADKQIAVQATSGTIDQQGRPFVHGFEIHLEKATLLFEFGVVGGEGSYAYEPTLLNSQGRALRPKLSDGDPLKAFQAEIKEVARCIRREVTSPILNVALAQDVVALCHQQNTSLRSGRKVTV